MLDMVLNIRNATKEIIRLVVRHVASPWPTQFPTFLCRLERVCHTVLVPAKRSLTCNVIETKGSKIQNSLIESIRLPVK